MTTTDTVAQRLISALRSAAQAYAPGDQTAPCALLWPDPERLWESVMPDLRLRMPELFLFGSYEPENRTGPSLWLRCIEARTVDGAPPPSTVPVFYLPGVSKDELRAAEDCSQALAALIELQYRGALWLHVNGKEWTPLAFLVSSDGGLELDVAKDKATREALVGALPLLMSQSIAQLQTRHLDAAYFNDLVAPDTTGLLLRWLGDPDGFRKSRPDSAWKAFCERGKAEYHFDPSKEAPLKAARYLAGLADAWKKVWARFAEAPSNYPWIATLLAQAAPKEPTLYDSAEFWPHLNTQQEQELDSVLKTLVDRPQDEVTRKVIELESKHARRRGYPWQKLGMSPLATALEPLARLATLCQATPGAPTPEAYASYYAKEGWRVDAAAIETMAACETAEQHGGVLGTLRSIYLPWLDTTARHLQQLVRHNHLSTDKRAKPVEAKPGRLVLFTDGLRMDVANRLVAKLGTLGIEATEGWEWSTIPSVTASAKPAASPIADLVTGGAASDEFATRLAATGQPLTSDRFATALKGRGWQCLGASDTGDPTGWAWTEAGRLDSLGHGEGWKLAHSVEREVRDLASRIGALLKAGWTEVFVVTDHGWLLMPDGLPKVELKAYLAEDRWGRCAAMKPDAQADMLTLEWTWNASVTIASPPGAGCFRASREYSHGGVSLQEMVTPVLRMKAANPASGAARLTDAKWTSARCRVIVSGDISGYRVDVRGNASDSATSMLSDHQARDINPDGKVTVYLEDDSDIGKEAVLVLLDSSGRVMDSRLTKLGE